eukprot:m.74928 g.74928  ORF g.74928 m.74928 type:complete len:1145 (-) comp10359_c0_seq1:117-3551(-)
MPLPNPSAPRHGTKRPHRVIRSHRTHGVTAARRATTVRWLVWLVMSTAHTGAVGCSFHCGSAATLCGNPVSVIRVILYVFPGGGILNSTGGRGDSYTATKAVDLSSRGITKILPGGLNCWNFTAGSPNSPLTAVVLDNNPLGVIPAGDLFDGVQYVSLNNCSIQALPPGCLHSFLGGPFSTPSLNAVIFYLSNNSLTSLSPNLFDGIVSQPGLVLTHNEITNVGVGILGGFGSDSTVNLDLSSNILTTVGPLYGPNPPVEAQVIFSGNPLVFLEPKFAQFTQNVTSLSLVVDNTPLSSLPDDLFGGWGGHMLFVSLQSNALRTAGAVFGESFVGTGAVLMQLQNNHLTAESMLQMVNSYKLGLGELILNVSFNKITELPPYLIGEYGESIPRASHPTVPLLTLDASYNPIVHVAYRTFAKQSSMPFGDISVDISHSTAGPITYPSELCFSGSVFPSFNPGSTLTFTASNTSANVTEVTNAFSTFLAPLPNPADVDDDEGNSSYLDCGNSCGSTCSVVLILQSNNVSAIHAGDLGRGVVSQLDLSHNGLTFIDGEAYAYTFFLRSLDLSYNKLTVVPTMLQTNAPVLEQLQIHNNQIVAIPLTSNHISNPADASVNVLQCAEYGPTLKNCTCPKRFHVDVHCLYVRCTPVDEPNGCPDNLLYNSSNCSAGPWSACVNPNSVLGRQYWNAGSQSFVPVTDCRTAFPLDDGSGFSKAYQVRNCTITSDRQCSICSVCPSAYDTISCTATQNARCVRETRLSDVAIAATVLGVTLALVLIGIAVAFVVRRNRRELRRTRSSLVLTEQELDGKREEVERLTKAWEIPESDLAFGRVLGSGAEGRVYSATWGHIPVAVKVLAARSGAFRNVDGPPPIEREVEMLRSTRHPHVLVFYGAGVNVEGSTFLVTELMIQGSLKALLRDTNRSLGWTDRVQFAGDIAAGMRYLHSKEIVHLDLKADNCFVDEACRVKVGDLGTGRIISVISPDEMGPRALHNVGGRSLTQGIGSLLWMAPEALTGGRIAPEDVYAVDVYSFAIVLWEIWTRDEPWSELEVSNAQIWDELSALVISGGRPKLPPVHDPMVPDGYHTLMTDCWSSNVPARPSFNVIVAKLDVIIGSVDRDNITPLRMSSEVSERVIPRSLRHYEDDS